jgi:hypothetical protein
MDHLAWDLGDPGGSMLSETEATILGDITLQFHPMKGPMTTLALRGLLNLAPYHWRGEQANLQTFNTTFSSLLGGAQLSSSNMNLYASFINTILYPPNPFENVDRTLSTSLAAAGGGNPSQGQKDFNNVAETKAAGLSFTCNNCHTASPSGPGTNLLILPFVPTDTTQPMKIPQLRNVYQKLLFNPTGADIDGFGLEDDGAAANLTTFLQAPPFVGYTAQQLKDIYAYCLQFDTGTAPAVGFTHTLTSANVATAVSQSDWTLLQSQAALGNIDLVVRGTLSGQVHGLLYQPSTGTYLSDASILYTQAQLQNLVQAGDTLSIMGVYPGTGSATAGTIIALAAPAAPTSRTASR